MEGGGFPMPAGSSCLPQLVAVSARSSPAEPPAVPSRACGAAQEVLTRRAAISTRAWLNNLSSLITAQCQHVCICY